MAINMNNNKDNSENTITNNNMNMKEDTMNIINLNTTKHTNKVEIIKKAGTSYLAFNGSPVGVISEGEYQEDNLRCIQFMVDQCDKTDNPLLLAYQCARLTQVMADLKDIDLTNTMVFDGVEYAIDTTAKVVVAENGEKLFELKDIYPELENEELPDEAIEAILVAEIPNHAIYPMALHKEENKSENLNIVKSEKLSIFATIEGLRALGMSAEWFDVNGVRQPTPICYNGKGDLNKFTKVVQECVEADVDWFDTMVASCNYKKNDLNPAFEVYNVNGKECVIDFNTNTIWDVLGEIKYATLDDIKTELPKAAVKALLIKRAKEEMKRLEGLDGILDILLGNAICE